MESKRKKAKKKPRCLRIQHSFASVRACSVASVVFDSLQCYGLQPAKLPCAWNFPGKNTGVGCHSLLQGIFPAQGSNPGLLNCRQILYHLSYQMVFVDIRILNEDSQDVTYGNFDSQTPHQAQRHFLRTALQSDTLPTYVLQRDQVCISV